MGDWKAFTDKIKELLKSKNLSAAKEELAIGLEKFPNQVNLLTIATDVYRASGDREKSLEYSELLITHHSGKWNGYVRAAQDLVELKRFDQAQEKVQSGLEKFPNQVNLLTIATDVYRASGDREKSLEYSELLITHHSGKWNGYVRAAQDLVELKRFDQAQEKVQSGLEKFTNQVNLLTIATDIYRASGDRGKSLEYSELLITHHPENWNGYVRAAQDLVALKRFDQAQEKVQSGLEKFPNQVNLLTIATDIYRASGDRGKSLEYSELLITHHPENWNGYGRAAQDLVALQRFEEAKIKVQEGFRKYQNQFIVLYEDDFLRIFVKHVPESKACVVQCGGKSIPESALMDTVFKNANIFRIIDKEEKWSNTIDIDILKDFFALFGSFSEVIATGVSSNGTSALFLGPLLNAKTIIAFSPQYTIFPDYNPSLFAKMSKNKRVAERINGIKEWKYKSLKDVDKHGSQEFVFFGGSPHDLSQCKSFLENPISARRCIPIKGTKHKCNKDLEKNGVLSPLIRLCLDGASESDCVQLLNEFGFEVCKVPEGITASLSA